MTGTKRTVGVIGAGMVGVMTAIHLLRDGHAAFILDPEPPGTGASFGNAGCFNPSSVVPMSLPGVIRKVPGWLADPLGPLAVRWAYLPRIAPWLLRYVRAGRMDRVEAQARALKGLLGPCLDILLPLVREAGAQEFVRRQGILVAYRSEASRRGDDLAWELRRRNGVVFARTSRVTAGRSGSFSVERRTGNARGVDRITATATRRGETCRGVACWPR